VSSTLTPSPLPPAGEGGVVHIRQIYLCNNPQGFGGLKNAAGMVSDTEGVRYQTNSTPLPHKPDPHPGPTTQALLPINMNTSSNTY
jgi:hypothetical protein